MASTSIHDHSLSQRSMSCEWSSLVQVCRVAGTVTGSTGLPGQVDSVCTCSAV